MKKTLWTSAAAGIVALSWYVTSMAGGIASQNAVGYTKADVQTGHNLLAFNWDDDEVSVQDVFVDVNGFTTNNMPSQSDNLLLWMGSSFKLLNLRGDGQWWDPDPSNTPEVSTNTIISGDAFWLLVRGSNMQVRVQGQVPTAATNENVIVQGLNMLGSAFPTQFDPNDDAYDWEALGATGGGLPSCADTIMFWTGSSYKLIYLRKADWKWYEPVGNMPVLSTNILQVGEGVWYRRRGADPITLEQARPYSL
jgi:hypothetical protein